MAWSNSFRRRKKQDLTEEVRTRYKPDRVEKGMQGCIRQMSANLLIHVQACGVYLLYQDGVTKHVSDCCDPIYWSRECMLVQKRILFGTAAGTGLAVLPRVSKMEE